MFSRGLRYTFTAFLSVVFCSLIGSASNVKMSRTYWKWLNEDVHWIITPQEQADFQQLSTDQQRDDFIRAFWERRDPTSGTPENEFKEEHYMRLAFANEHFSSNVPGWMTDRGRIYILYGPPDSIEVDKGFEGANLLGENKLQLPAAHYIVWHYRYILGSSEKRDFTFVDTCRCNEYKLVDAQ